MLKIKELLATGLKLGMEIFCLILWSSRLKFRNQTGKNIIMKKIIKAIAVLLAAVSATSSCSRPASLYKDTRVIMGTYVTITAVKP